MNNATREIKKQADGNAGKQALSLSKIGRAPLGMWTENFLTKEPTPHAASLHSVQEKVFSDAKVREAMRKADGALGKFEPKEGVKEVGAGAEQQFYLCLPAREELRILQDELRTAYFAACESAGLSGPHAPHPADLAIAEFYHLLSGVLTRLQGTYREILGGGEKAKSALFDFAYNAKNYFFQRGGCGGA